MVVNDLNLCRACFRPPEADSELIVDTDTVLTRALAPQVLEPVPGRYTKVLDCLGGIQRFKLPYRHAPQLPRKSLASCARGPTVEDVFSPGASERPDHTRMIA